MKFNTAFVKEYDLQILLGIFILAQIIVAALGPTIWWDEAVYVGMGKHIYSAGFAGLWEPVRPIILPALIGPLQLVPFNLEFLTRLIMIAIAVFGIIGTYALALKLFNEKIAIIAAALIAFNPTYFFFSTKILTGILSTTILVFAVLFLYRKNFFVAGLLLGLAHLSRFLQLFVIAVIMTVFTLQYFKEQDFFKQILAVAKGFFAVVIPFWIINWIAYGNPWFPYLQQIFFTENTGSIYNQAATFYFAGIAAEALILCFAVFAVYIYTKDLTANKHYALPLAVVAIAGGLYTVLEHKELRFVITLLPYLAILAAAGLYWFQSKLPTKRYQVLGVLIIGVFALLQLGVTTAYNFGTITEDNQYELYWNYLHTAEGQTWISDPIMAFHSNNKVSNLMYYPLFNENTKNYDLNRILEAQSILVNTCSLDCSEDETACEETISEYLQNLESETLWIHTFEETEVCQRIIFAR